MVDPTLELERLKSVLRAKGMSDSLVHTIVEKASEEMNSAITDKVAEAMQQAVAAGVEKEAEKFVSELKAMRVGDGFAISTDSGMTDFSNPPFPMLPWLLKNPKVAKDGTLYKVIPVGSRNSPRSAFDLAEIQKQIDAMRKDARQRGFGSDMFSGAETFSGTFAAQKVAQRNAKVTREIDANSGKPSFRTVTSKQDPNSNWVLPEKEADMTATLVDINNSLRAAIEDAIMDIVRIYTESY